MSEHFLGLYPQRMPRLLLRSTDCHLLRPLPWTHQTWRMHFIRYGHFPSHCSVCLIRNCWFDSDFAKKKYWPSLQFTRLSTKSTATSQKSSTFPILVKAGVEASWEGELWAGGHNLNWPANLVVVDFGHYSIFVVRLRADSSLQRRYN